MPIPGCCGWIKALRCGLRADTREVEVSVPRRLAGGSGRLEVRRRADGAVFAGVWWRDAGQLVTVLVRGGLDRLVDLGR